MKFYFFIHTERFLSLALPWVWLSLSFGSAQAACKYELEKSEVLTSAGVTGELSLVIQDCEPVANACDYHLESFDDLPSKKVLSLKLGSEPCFVDRYGKQKLRFRWNLPSSLRSGGKLYLLVNQVEVGKLDIQLLDGVKRIKFFPKTNHE